MSSALNLKDAQMDYPSAGVPVKRQGRGVSKGGARNQNQVNPNNNVK